jgi:hypothetical protein
LLEGRIMQVYESLCIDLGIDVNIVKQKLIAVLTQRGIKDNLDYDDMAGPLLICVIFGFLLLLVIIGLIPLNFTHMTTRILNHLIERQSTLRLYLRFLSFRLCSSLLNHLPHEQERSRSRFL